MNKEIGYVLGNHEIAPGIFDMTVYAPKIAAETSPGQFVNFYTGKGEMLLPRPISVCNCNPDYGTVRFVFQAVGNGTKYFSTLKVNETISLLGPLGNGFTVMPEKKAIFVGGGIGLPPLLYLARQWKHAVVLAGFRTQSILIPDFLQLGAQVHIATDTGEEGYRGTVVDLLDQLPLEAEILYSCGPKPMLQAVSNWAKEHGIPIQVSMEERMACGLGACIGCAVKISTNGEEKYAKVCKDGPVFWGNEVIWND